MANRPTDNNDVIVDQIAFLELLEAGLISTDASVRNVAERYLLTYVQRSAIANGASVDFAAGVKRIIGRRIDAQVEAPPDANAITEPVAPR